MINLLLDLQQQMGLSYVLISQNLGIVRHFSDEIIILSYGKVIEKGNTAQVLANPEHKYTKKLILGQQHSILN